MKKSVTRLLVLLTAVFALIAFAGCELTGTNNLNDADRRGKPDTSSVSTPPTVYEGAEGDSLLLAEENFIEFYYPEEDVEFTGYAEPYDFTPYDPVLLTLYEPEVYFYYDNGIEVPVSENDPLATHKKTGFYTTGFNLIGYNTIGERIIGWESAVFDLWAGQDNNAGTVTVSNDNEFFYITIDTNTTADLEEVHINVYEALEELPAKRPAPGQAPYSAKEIYADSVTVQIPVTELADMEDYYFVIHEALVADAVGSGDGESNAGETAYAAGDDPNYDGRGAWFYAVGYTLHAVIEYITEDVFEDVYEDVIEELETEDDDDYVLPSGSETAFGVMVS